MATKQEVRFYLWFNNGCYHIAYSVMGITHLQEIDKWQWRRMRKSAMCKWWMRYDYNGSYTMTYRFV